MEGIIKMTLEHKIQQTVNWIEEQVKQSGTRGVLVGISGGIDSAVVASLIHRAMPEHSMGVILPCKSNPKDADDARALAEAIGIKYVVIDLTDEHDRLLNKITDALPHAEGATARLTDANLRARLRMSTLYGLANRLGYLVAGTDNAAEIHTGYFTKYGDGGVDIVPISNLLKREVFQWAKALGVPEQIIERKPSAGLWEGQTDEAEMGTTYDCIDDYLLGLEIPDADRQIIERMHRATAHKRLMPPGPPTFEAL